ncbi:hypothetical protein AGMMS49992_12400 [Clostridia bacterium]|nr:hypothetical protein AGMMS49992_12400 [Clostridia bacterium]
MKSSSNFADYGGNGIGQTLPRALVTQALGAGRHVPQEEVNYSTK